MSQVNKAKAMMAANRLKRLLDRAGRGCPPLSTLVEPKGAEVKVLIDMLNDCMVNSDEVGVEAENLWNALGLTELDALQSQRKTASPLAQEPAALDKNGIKPVVKPVEKPAVKPPEKPAKGFFKWLTPEEPKESEKDEDDDGDGHYKGGLR